MVRLARRGRQGSGNRDHIKAFRSSRRSLRVLLCPLSGGVRPAGRDRHPGVGTLVAAGEATPFKRRAPSGSRRWRLCGPDFSASGTVMVDPRRPVPPGELPARLDALEAAVRGRTDLVPLVGIVLGSGLGGLADVLAIDASIPFADLPGWPPATAPGHVGRLLLGRLEGVPVAMLLGRLHLYEGNAPGLVVQPVLLVGRLGARAMVLTNASGGVNPDYAAGTLMLISDHLNLTGQTPLLGPNAPSMGARFPDLLNAWSPRLRTGLRAAAKAEGVELAEGIYAGLLGPAFET